MAKKVATYEQMLASIRPEIAGEYVFACVPKLPTAVEICALIREPEGYTIAISPEDASALGLDNTHRFTLLNMGAQGSLDVVGLVSAVAQILSSRSIPCNVFSGIHHTHLFVPTKLLDQTIACLQELSLQAKAWLDF